ncbi:MAG: trimethylamine methyltransferase family protein [Anaerolineales bacterium]|nr:trimethylamine methyltransferase family protein [Anaerolineales bacterium]
MRPNLPHRLEFLTPDQVQQVHQTVLRVLAEVGVRVDWPPALEILAANGCKVDFEQRLAFIPEDVLNRALDTTPSEFQLHARNPAQSIAVTLEDVYTIAGSSALNVLDLDGNHRPATLQDLCDFTRLIDALELADIMHAMVIPQDIPQPGFDRILFATILENSSKHYYSQGEGEQSVHDQVQMASVIQGSTEAVRQAPIFSLVTCLTSPLIHPAERVQEMIACAEYGIPLWLEATNMMGATAPVTIAGALVEHTANVLASLTFVQLLRPGHPCIIGVASGGLNMRTGTYVGASPEATLLHVASVQMAHYYGLPLEGSSGLDACLPDAQAAYERALQDIPYALAGMNFIHLAFGMMNQLLTSSYEQAIIDHEILAAAYRLAEGFQVSEETLAFDQIRQAGPGGQFLTHPYTLRRFKEHQWQPRLTSRLEWTQFQRQLGGADMRQRANQLARQILASHQPLPLEEKQAQELQRMAQAFQRATLQNP